MNFFNSIFSRFARDKPEEAESYGKDIEGRPIYRQDIEKYVLDELERRRNEKRFLELQWQLNSNFLYGNQRCDINEMSGTIEQYDLPFDAMENEVFNQIEPLYKTRLANLNKVSYAMTVNPRTSELDDVAKAYVSTSLLRYKQATSGFNDFKTKLYGWSEITGTAFILNWWDENKGDKAGEVIVNEETEDGNQVLKKVPVYSGDVEYGMLSSFEVFPESVYKQNVKDQRSIIIEQVMTADEIYDLYGVKVVGNSIDTYGMSTIEGAGGFGYVASVAKMTSRTIDNAEKVITCFEKRSRAFPDGRLIILIGDKLHYYGPLPYDEIPIIAVKSDEVAGQFFGRSFIQSLIPLQRAYNGMMNTVHDYMRRLSVSNVLVEEGSVEDVDEFLDNLHQPGGLLKYKKGYDKPSYVNPSSFPSDVHNQIAKIKNDMEYIAGVSQLMVYGQKNGVTSGTAIQSLTEIDNTRLLIPSENMRNAILETAKMWLSMYKKCASGYRILRIAGGNDAGDVLIWNSEDINSYDIKYDVENELVFSEEAQKQNFVAAFNMGLFTEADGSIPERFKKKALQLLKINNYTDIMGINELHRQKANRENGFARLGVPPVCEDFDDHTIHIEEHEKFILQMEYQALKKSNSTLCEQFEQHIRDHKTRKQQTDMQNIQQMPQINGG